MSQTPSGQTPEELLEKTKESYEEKKQKQDEALAAIKQGGELEQYETVTLGELDLEVKAWLPGDSIDTIERVQQAAESNDISRIKESMTQITALLADMTTEYDLEFWEAYYDEFGPTGMILAVESVFDPAIQNMEEEGEALGNSHGRIEAGTSG